MPERVQWDVYVEGLREEDGRGGGRSESGSGKELQLEGKHERGKKEEMKGCFMADRW